jgi:large subunit ribosomal protein L11
MDFCKQFNDATKHYQPGIPIPTKISIRPDRTFTFTTTAPPAAWLLKAAAGLEKGATRPGIDPPVATLSLKHIYEVARIKARDPALAQLPLERVARRILHTCHTIGIRVVA